MHLKLSENHHMILHWYYFFFKYYIYVLRILNMINKYENYIKSDIKSQNIIQ